MKAVNSNLIESVCIVKYKDNYRLEVTMNSGDFHWIGGYERKEEAVAKFDSIIGRVPHLMEIC